MYFRIAVVRGRRYVQVVAGVLVMLAGTAVSGRAQDSTASSTPFHVGDRIALTVDGPLALADTFVVREGLILQIPHIGDIPLKGVSRVNIQPYLTQQIGQFVKNPVVRATPLISISVAGNVGRPGYYAVPTDAILSDVVMRAGGPTGNADLGKTVIQRSGKVLLDEKQTSTGLNRGKTLEDLQLMSGDQILVGEKVHHDIETYVQIGSILLGVVGLVLTVARH